MKVKLIIQQKNNQFLLLCVPPAKSYGLKSNFEISPFLILRSGCGHSILVKILHFFGEFLDIIDCKYTKIIWDIFAICKGIIIIMIKRMIWDSYLMCLRRKKQGKMQRQHLYLGRSFLILQQISSICISYLYQMNYPIYRMPGLISKTVFWPQCIKLCQLDCPTCCLQCQLAANLSQLSDLSRIKSNLWLFDI